MIYKIQNLLVPLTYLRILFVACQCASFGLSMNLEIKLTANIISCLVAVKYMRLPTMLLYKLGSKSLVMSSLMSFNPIIVGVIVALLSCMLNLSNTSLAYFHCEIKILFPFCSTSIPKNYLSKPMSVISNYPFMIVL